MENSAQHPPEPARLTRFPGYHLVQDTLGCLWPDVLDDPPELGVSGARVTGHVDAQGGADQREQCGGEQHRVVTHHGHVHANQSLQRADTALVTRRYTKCTKSREQFCFCGLGPMIVIICYVICCVIVSG